MPSSDIHDHLAFPPPIRLTDLEPVPGDRLHFSALLMPRRIEPLSLDFTADGIRNDGKDTPFAAGHKVDDLFFFIQADGKEEVNLLIDEVVLYDAGKR